MQNSTSRALNARSVGFSLTDGIATITLDRSEKRNALSQELLAGLQEALMACQLPDVRVAILRAAPGAQVWAAGHDISELPHGAADPIDWSDALHRAIRAVGEIDVPVLALVEGTVWGAACELALSCDLIFAAPQATFALTPARLGLAFNTAGIQLLLAKTTSKVAAEMVFGADPISAERLERAGLVNGIAEQSELDGLAYGFARSIARNAPLSIALMKRQLRALENQVTLPSAEFERLESLRRKLHGSMDYAEGRSAFMEKRSPAFRGM